MSLVLYMRVFNLSVFLSVCCPFLWQIEQMFILFMFWLLLIYHVMHFMQMQCTVCSKNFTIIQRLKIFKQYFTCIFFRSDLHQSTQFHPENFYISQRIYNFSLFDNKQRVKTYKLLEYLVLLFLKQLTEFSQTVC